MKSAWTTVLAMLLAAVLLGAPAPSFAAGKVALLIGNSAYPGDKDHPGKWAHLANTKNDVSLVASALRKAGFATVTVEDADHAALESAIDKFATAAEGADIAVFYYAGHGFEFNRRNYLVPVDGPTKLGMSELPASFVDFEKAANRIARAKTTVFMLDACRTSVPIVTVSTADLANLAASLPINDYQYPPGAKIAVVYSTALGVPALDAAPPPTNYSPFAWQVAQYVTVPRVDLTLLIQSITRGVMEKTRDFAPPQQPYSYNSIDSRVFLADSEPAPAPGTAPKVPDRLSIPPGELATTDEPALAVKVLSQHSFAELLAMAEHDDPLASYMVGYMLEYGIGTALDLPKARTMLSRAAALGTASGQLEYAWFLQHHPHGPEDQTRALALFKAAAEQGLAKARGHYAAVLMNGRLVAATQENYDAGLEQLRLAAESGYPYAMFALATQGTADERPQWRGRLDTLAMAGNEDAHHWLCELDWSAGKAADAAPHCQKAAAAGFADSRARLAIAAFEGRGRAKSEDEARHWLLQALSQPDLDPGLRAQLLSVRSALGRS